MKPHTKYRGKMYPEPETGGSLLKKYIHIGTVVLAYWVISISLVFVNKYLLSGEDKQLDAPFFITWFQCVVTVILCFVIWTGSKAMPSLISFPPLELDFQIIKQTLLLSIVFVGMITFNNLCLKYVGVAFYFIGRSLTTVFNVVLTYVIIHQRTSSGAIICCIVIILGFLLGVDQENVSGSLSVKGVLYGVLASLFVALYAIYIKKVLPVVRGDVTLLTYYNNLNAALLFIPLIIVSGEHTAVINFHWSWKYLCLLVASGGFGFATGYLINLQVKVTSPLTNNISGTAKACVQTILACLWYKEGKPYLWWLSNLVVLGGSAAYTRVRQLEMKRDFDVQRLATQTENKPVPPRIKDNP